MTVNADNWRIHYRTHEEISPYADEKVVNRGGWKGIGWFVPLNNVGLFAHIYCGNNIESLQKEYIKHFSIVHYLPAVFCFMHCFNDTVCTVNDDEVLEFVRLPQGDEIRKNVKSNIVIILFESLESWAVEYSYKGRDIAPNLKKLMNSNHVCYFDKVKSQARNGVSGDGQLSVVTGLLPIRTGAASVLFGDNVYPNYAHFFDFATIINPWPDMWNQNVVTYSYGFKELLEPKNEKWYFKDRETFDELYSYMSGLPRDSTSCILTMTIASHLPFNVQDPDANEYDDDVPDMVARYLDCISFSDKYLGEFLEKILSDPILKNYTIVITGDHTVFKQNIISQLKEIPAVDKSKFAQDYSYWPLLIYSPSIDGNIQNHEECYQMDIYPTILDLIGVDNYYWKGFGINLLDKNAIRQINENDAFELSNRIIRTNYFKKFFDE